MAELKNDEVKACLQKLATHELENSCTVPLQSS
ncbi:hypothetical protein KIPB_000337, partial [Kipferlia bialata]|eukprot:g337.t1